MAASGKTDVYLAAMQEVPSTRASRSLLLVPETSLVPQLADRVRAVAGEALAVLHWDSRRGAA